MVATWGKFLSLNSNPDWQPAIGSVQPGKTQRLLCMVVLTAIVLLCVMGPVLLFDLPFSFVLVIGHGLLHPVPDMAEDAPETSKDTPNEKLSFGGIDLSKVVNLGP